ncbi:hypothetical protein DOY81_000507, partial [Sarcophaga bullata]
YRFFQKVIGSNDFIAYIKACYKITNFLRNFITQKQQQILH